MKLRSLIILIFSIQLLFSCLKDPFVSNALEGKIKKLEVYSLSTSLLINTITFQYDSVNGKLSSGSTKDINKVDSINFYIEYQDPNTIILSYVWDPVNSGISQYIVHLNNNNKITSIEDPSCRFIYNNNLLDTIIPPRESITNGWDIWIWERKYYNLNYQANLGYTGYDVTGTSYLCPLLTPCDTITGTDRVNVTFTDHLLNAPLPFQQIVPNYFLGSHPYPIDVNYIMYVAGYSGQEINKYLISRQIIFGDTTDYSYSFNSANQATDITEQNHHIKITYY